MKEKTANTSENVPNQEINARSIKFDNWYSRSIYEGEKNEIASLTEPNQAMDVRTILQRFARGQSGPVINKPVYNDSEDLVKYQKMDIFEKMDALHENEQNINSLRNEIESELKNQKPEPSEGTN